MEEEEAEEAAEADDDDDEEEEAEEEEEEDQRESRMHQRCCYTPSRPMSPPHKFIQESFSHLDARP